VQIRPLLLAILICTSPVSLRAADETSAIAEEAGERKILRTFLDDGRYLLTFPSRPTRRGVVLTASVLAATGILVTRDEEIRDWVQENRTETSSNLESVFEPIGRVESGLVITGGAYLLGRWTHREKLRKTSAVAFEAFVYTGAITALAKGAFGREGSRDPSSTGQFWEGGDIFPSGHTSRSFAIASVFAESYGKPAAWVGYSIATLAGLARIESSDHWASDVLAGGALGIAIGKALSRRHALRPKSARPVAVRIGPREVRVRFAFGRGVR
jgi:membrane-associated phospholipid phosphatase